MRILAKTKGLSEEKWLALRRKGIGGSDASAVVGMNPWQSALSIYYDKIGEGVPIEQTERMRIGKDLEDYVAQRFSEDSGLKVRRKNAILMHKEHDFLIANIDREIVGKKEGLECKVTNSFAASQWYDNQIPSHYELQCHHYMLVTGYKAWWIAVLIGNDRVIHRRIERDEEVISWLYEQERAFWHDHVLARKEPAPSGLRDVDNIILEKFGEIISGKSIELVGYTSKVKRRLDLKNYLDEMAREYKELDQDIKLAMGDAQYAVAGPYLLKKDNIEYKRFGNKNFRAANPDMVTNYLKQIKYQKLTITEE